ncbi:MAG: hypothetical protein U0903_18055 [Planctomycetales bacterium]
MFFRLNADGSQQTISLEGTFGGPFGSACWLIGGGPSLQESDWQGISASPIPKLGINLAGSGFFRPTFWTGYDPSARFHRSVYLDPGIMKFVHRRRGMDLVPETSFKVCDCPNTYFFEGDRSRGFADFVSQRHQSLVDWADTMVQGIDLLFHLGFRRIYLAGCEMRVTPTELQREAAARKGVLWSDHTRLSEFLTACEKQGLTAAMLDEIEEVSPYHFDERKSIRGAANTDSHYFRVAQYLRLSRRGMALAGLQLVSVTPHSRLNDYFPVMDTADALEEILQQVGDPQGETTRGRYRLAGPRVPQERGPMRDFRPLNWNENGVTRPEPNQLQGNLPQKDDDLIVEAEGLERAMPGPVLQRELSRRLDRPAEIVEEG